MDFRKAGKSLRDTALGAGQYVDDKSQAFIRNHILGLPSDGTHLPHDAGLRGVREGLGSTVFAARHGYEGDKTDYRVGPTRGEAIGAGLSRALQGGSITAAGLGLAGLTNQFETMFGGAADRPSPAELSPEYDYQARVPDERYYAYGQLLPPGDRGGSSEGELLVAGLKGYGPFAEVDDYLLASRLNDLNESMGYGAVRGWGEPHESI